MTPEEVYQAWLNGTRVVAKIRNYRREPVVVDCCWGYIVNLTADGRPVFASSLRTRGIGLVMNFSEVAIAPAHDFEYAAGGAQ